MKRTFLFLLVVLGLVWFSCRAQAGVSVSVGIGTPGYYAPYYTPYYAPYTAPVVVYPGGYYTYPSPYYYRPAPPPPPHHHHHPAPPPHHHGHPAPPPHPHHR